MRITLDENNLNKKTNKEAVERYSGMPKKFSEKKHILDIEDKNIEIDLQGTGIEIKGIAEGEVPEVYIWIDLEDFLRQINLQKLQEKCKDVINTTEKQNRKFLEKP